MHPSCTPPPAPHRPSPRRRSLLVFTAIGTALGAALVAGCASRPEVRHDRDPSADLRSYRTFAFQEPSHPMPDAPGAGYATLQEVRLRQAARQALERHGLSQVAHGPDLRVHLAMKVAQRQELHASPGARGIGVGPRGWNATRIDTVDVRHGTLVVDLVDVRRNALVWRGVVEGAVDRADLHDAGAAIERAMAEVFAGFKP